MQYIKTWIQGIEVHLARPMKLPLITEFTSHKRVLEMCKAAWKNESSSPSLNFRLEGAPGVEKNKIVYQLAQKLNMDLYTIIGHKDLRPEDLVLTVVPGHESAQKREMPLVLRASPLVTALLQGGLFFFDQIDRCSARALSPLCSVLDGRKAIYSAITGMWIEPSKKAKRSFRFCCALNTAGNKKLPPYIEQRTLPVIVMELPEFKELWDSSNWNMKPSEKLLDAYHQRYHEEAWEILERQALSQWMALSQLQESMPADIKQLW